jgi:hypothetical protein
VAVCAGREVPDAGADVASAPVVKAAFPFTRVGAASIGLARVTGTPWVGWDPGGMVIGAGGAALVEGGCVGARSPAWYSSVIHLVRAAITAVIGRP